jgi:hypothetical protein
MTRLTSPAAFCGGRRANRANWEGEDRQRKRDDQKWGYMARIVSGRFHSELGEFLCNSLRLPHFDSLCGGRASPAPFLSVCITTTSLT